MFCFLVGVAFFAGVGWAGMSVVMKINVKIMEVVCLGLN